MFAHVHAVILFGSQMFELLANSSTYISDSVNGYVWQVTRSM